MVRQYIIINGNEIDIESIKYDPRCKRFRRAEAIIRLKTDYSSAKEMFSNNLAWSYVVETTFDGVTKKEISDMSDYCILVRITDSCDEIIEVVMRQLTDTEKLIQLHYGGIN